MKQEERYEQWLERVRNNPPSLDDPQELSREIMQRIASTPRRQSRPVANFIKWFSAVAALFLLGVMLHEMFYYSSAPLAGKEAVNLRICPPAEILLELSSKPMSGKTVREKGVVFSRFRKKRKDMQRKKEDFINRLIKSNR